MRCPTRASLNAYPAVVDMVAVTGSRTAGIGAAESDAPNAESDSTFERREARVFGQSTFNFQREKRQEIYELEIWRELSVRL